MFFLIFSGLLSIPLELHAFSGLLFSKVAITFGHKPQRCAPLERPLRTVCWTKPLCWERLRCMFLHKEVTLCLHQGEGTFQDRSWGCRTMKSSSESNFNKNFQTPFKHLKLKDLEPKTIGAYAPGHSPHQGLFWLSSRRPVRTVVTEIVLHLP
jgi:hypothetical protein